MKKILIVEDEILVRIGIKSIVPWEKYGYSVIGEAGNGQEALQKIRQESPDIVLSDLVMENGDGFWLMEQCRIEFPKIRFVILSGYDDLHHVKKAMKLGAVDYVFKLTLSPQQIIEVLNDIKFEEERNLDEHREVLNKNKQAIKNNLLKKAVSQQYRCISQLMEQLKQLSLEVDFCKKYGILYLSIDNYLVFERNDAGPMEGDLLKYSIENMLKEILADKCLSEIFDYQNGDLMIMVQMEKGDISQKQIKEVFEWLNKQLMLYFNVSVSGSFLENCTGIQELPENVKELQCLIQERFLAGKAGFYMQRNLNEKTQSDEVFVYIKNLRDVLQSGSEEGIAGCIDEIYEYCTESRLCPQLCRIVYFDILAELKGDIKLRKDLHDYKDENGYSLYDGIVKYDFLFSIQKSFLDFIHKVFCFSLKSSEKHRKEILEAKAYVRKNLRETLTVAAVAGMVYMSDNYFSHLFKKETGLSFIDFVNQERIEKAKELLLTTDDKIYDIAEQVGISSANYFGILFKRLTGMSPNEFRESKNFKRKL